jgi:formate dehydrogenase major subunit
MTNHWIDIRNADVVLIMGSNAAENHPISFKWVQAAREKGGILIHVDPRYTKTSTQADIYAPLRSGSDIPFLGGMINYILQKDLTQKDYVRLYTNASFIVNKDFKMPGELDGVFSGYDAAARKYDKTAWAFEKDAAGVVKKDPTLQNPMCVYQLLKKHYSRYDLDTVSSITGTPKEALLKVYEAYGSTGRADRVGTVMYAMGWTQHTVGTQNIVAMAIIQQLLGNMGMAGGGVNALRGESNVQGSTDQGLLFHILPGYLAQPRAQMDSLEAYLKTIAPETKEPRSLNWQSNYPKYAVSLLKAFWGEHATAENQFGYHWVPKLDETQNASWLNLFDAMLDGKFKGFLAWGQNPACSTSNAGKARKALGKLDWMVTVNLFDNETASFWRGPGLNPADVKTEVFFLPCAASVEKEGSLSNSGRWAQWRYTAVPPAGQSKPDAEIMHELAEKVRELYRKEGGAFPDPVLKVAWEFGQKDAAGKIAKVDTHLIAREINGYWLQDKELTDPKTKAVTGTFKKGQLVVSFATLQADGSTSCGNWIYSGSYGDPAKKEGEPAPDPKKGNKMARRGKEDPTGLGLYPNWSWSWPVNRRIVYNRASVDELGRPWDPKRPLVKWVPDVDPATKLQKNDPVTGKPMFKWAGDVIDGGGPPLKTPDGKDNPDSKLPFIMKPAGVASIFGNVSLNEGPFPEHYEPLECPIQENPLSKTHRINPTIKLFYKDKEKDADDVFLSCDTRYPYVATTYRVTEHWQTGVMTRHTPWLLEAVPQNFLEMSEELGREKGIRSGDMVKVSSPRGQILAVAIVSKRFRPFKVMGGTVHQVGMPWCFGWQYPEDGSGGDSANLLTSTVGDANTMIPETKAFMVNVEKA